VSNEFGEPVNNAQASLFRATYVSGARRLARVATAQTDDLGQFRMAGVAPGSYYLAVLRRMQTRPAPMAQAAAGEPGMGYGITWYPDAADASGAQAIALGAAPDAAIEVVLRRIKVVSIRGTVVDEAGGPVGRLLLSLTPRGLGLVAAVGDVSLAPGGVFAIANVPPGSYVLAARAADGVLAGDGNIPQPVAFLPIEVRDANLEGVQLRLSAGREVRGVVKWEMAGVQNAVVNLFTPEGASIGAMAVNGALTFRSVQPLTYAVDVRGLCATCYVKSLRYAGRDVPEFGVDFSFEGALEIVVSPSAASLDGVAVDRQGRPAGGATVILAAADTAGKIVTGQANQSGAFHFAALPPGVYRVLAWQGVAPEASPEALAPFQAQATAVSLTENARGTVRVAAIAR
jgi:hypothetical protein